MSGALPSPEETAGIIFDAIIDAIEHGNIEECVTSSGHRFWIFSRGPFAEAKASLRNNILLNELFNPPAIEHTREAD